MISHFSISSQCGGIPNVNSVKC